MKEGKKTAKKQCKGFPNKSDKCVQTYLNQMK